MIEEFYPAAVRATLKVRRSTAHDFDDLVQEGVIAAWQATTSQERRDPGTYGRVSMRHRITNVGQGKAPTLGTPRPEAKSRRGAEGKREGRLGRSFDPLRDKGMRVGLSEIEEFADPVDRLATAEMRAIVSESLNELESMDRLILFLVFWEDVPWSEIGPRFGYAPSYARRRFDRYIAPILRERLSAWEA
jgi:RNA polymerase sigma factor (sigma-70 family)